MKIEKQDKFTPVTITLETKEELDIFTEVFYRVGGDRVYNQFGSTSFIVNQLLNAGGEKTEEFEGKAQGSIYVK